MFKEQSGFGLLEILISLVVLSIGLLGLAGLQVTSMRFNHDSQLRSVAVVQAYAMADRMRANMAGMASGNYDNLTGTPGSAPACTTCTPAEITQLDLYRWNTTNATMLPSGQGTVTVNGNVHTITVRWDNNRTGATGLGCGGNPTVDLSCIQIGVTI